MNLKKQSIRLFNGNISDEDKNFITLIPGEGWCNPLIPHAKWHLETGIALADFVFLSDEINRIITEHALPK
jgi:hypothetical protein